MLQKTVDVFFKKWAIPSLLFFIFIFSKQLIVNKFMKFRRWLDSNRGSLVLEATVQPTEPQPLRHNFDVFVAWSYETSIVAKAATYMLYVA